MKDCWLEYLTSYSMIICTADFAKYDFVFKWPKHNESKFHYIMQSE